MQILRNIVLAVALTLSGNAAAGQAKQATLYKNPQCDCCEGYATYLRDHGFEVKVTATHDLPLIKKEHHVPASLEGCHTTLIDGYVVEGHVPVGSIGKLLNERPDIRGISLPGMPTGSPGMSGTKTKLFRIIEISGEQKVFAIE